MFLLLQVFLTFFNSTVHNFTVHFYNMYYVVTLEVIFFSWLYFRFPSQYCVTGTVYGDAVQISKYGSGELVTRQCKSGTDEGDHG